MQKEHTHTANHTVHTAYGEGVSVLGHPSIYKSQKSLIFAAINPLPPPHKYKSTDREPAAQTARCCSSVHRARPGCWRTLGS